MTRRMFCLAITALPLMRFRKRYDFEGVVQGQSIYFDRDYTMAPDTRLSHCHLDFHGGGRLLCHGVDDHQCWISDSYLNFAHRNLTDCIIQVWEK